MIRDAKGNEVKSGDVVFVQTNGTWIEAIVVESKPGGVLINPTAKAGQVGKTPDILTLQFTLACIEVPPGMPHPAIRRLINPEKETIVLKGN